ncbi:hypothetical protein PHYSODRAFT_363926, partial [Phytophthora sojae]
IQRLSSESGLHLLKPKKIERAYTKHAEKGLFGLFVSTRLKKAWRIWTNAVLVAKGETPITAEELDAFIGLELAMSLVPITDMKELWSDKKFQGHHDFKATMSRTRFQTIRGSLQIHPPLDATETEDTASSSDKDPSCADPGDPLWHSRHLLEHFQRKFAATAVPFGVSSLDENGVRTKARSA